jgi:hypothetical protein
VGEIYGRYWSKLGSVKVQERSGLIRRRKGERVARFVERSGVTNGAEACMFIASHSLNKSAV